MLNRKGGSIIPGDHAAVIRVIREWGASLSQSLIDQSVELLIACLDFGGEESKERLKAKDHARFTDICEYMQGSSAREVVNLLDMLSFARRGQNDDDEDDDEQLQEEEANVDELLADEYKDTHNGELPDAEGEGLLDFSIDTGAAKQAAQPYEDDQKEEVEPEEPKKSRKSKSKTRVRAESVEEDEEEKVEYVVVPSSTRKKSRAAVAPEAEAPASVRKSTRRTTKN